MIENYSLKRVFSFFEDEKDESYKFYFVEKKSLKKTGKVSNDLAMEINILILRHLNKIKRVQFPFPEYLQNS